jgi:hypothetical protein
MLTGDWPIINKQREEIKKFFIKDKYNNKQNRIFPNEQEITAYLQQHHNHSGFEIQYCKIFEWGLDEKSRPKFTIIIHFSKPKGYWMQYDIP